MEKKQKEDSETFISLKLLACRMLIGLVLLTCLGVACVVVGYYWGFISTNSSGIIDSEPDTVPEPEPGDFLIGVGRSDVTGPIAQVNMMGYANPVQTASGLHLRLYSRAFVVADTGNKTRVAFASVDMGMASQIVKLEVVKKLQKKYGNMFTERNVAISGTHSHSGPAGFFQTMLPEVTSLGAVKQSTDAFVDGIVKSIEQAHDSMTTGRLYVGTDTVDNGNINRSPSAYLKNPENERAQYQYNTEQEMTLLKFETKSGEPIGMFTWYPVHGTSMNFSNELISSDNRGRASALFERMMRKPMETQSGKESFVAAFASANLGDVSPRTKGPICIDTGAKCDFEKSTCGNPPRVQNCVAFGPGLDMFESTDIIAKKQVATADRIYKRNNELLDGTVSWVHQYVDMSKAQVKMDDGTTVSTCKPGMGYSFAAGTTDGAGAFDFVQSMTEGTLLWDTVRNDIVVPVVCTEAPPDDYYECHKPKPVLLPTGYMDRPYAWHPTIIDVQMLKIGQLIILAVPGEFTTMAGRRIKDAVKKQAQQSGLSNPKVVLAGLSNVYTHYITTPEEYTAQRYEGASTIFGPNTFTAYYQKYQELVQPLVQGTHDKVEPGPQPENILDQQIELLPPPSPDRVPTGKSFGDVIRDVSKSYGPGSNVSVMFYGANPRHNMKIDSTYLAVQELVNGTWETVFVDADWETRFSWVDANARRSTKDANVITAVLDAVAKIMGVRFDYEKALQVAEEGNVDIRTIIRESMADTVAAKRRNKVLLSKPESAGVFTLEREEVHSFESTVESHVTIMWIVPEHQPSGTFRIAYYADHVTEGGLRFPFEGYSSQFQIVNEWVYNEAS